MDLRTAKLAGVFVVSGIAGVGAYLPSPWSTITHSVCAPLLLALGVSIKTGGGLKELLAMLPGMKDTSGSPPK
jgi:hypothetical protein